LDESIRATEQQKQAAEQVAAAMVQIRAAAEQLAAEGPKRTDAAQRVAEQVSHLQRTLSEHGMSAGGQVSNGRPVAAGNVTPAEV
jgi:methyl-accepting chemotaxis protein